MGGLGSRTTLLVAPGTWVGRAGLSCAWAGCWMGKACVIHTGLRLVSGWHTLRPVSDCRHVRLTLARWAGPELGAGPVAGTPKISRPAGQDFGPAVMGWGGGGGGAGPAKFWLGRGLGEGKSEDSLWRRDLSALGPFGAEANFTL